MKKSNFLASLGLIFFAGSIALPATADPLFHLSWNSKGVPKVILRPSTPATPGTRTDVIIQDFEKEVSLSTLNACGYKTISPGTKADSVQQVVLAGTVIPVSSLPVFDGSCRSGVLTPRVSGATIPASHYVDMGGKVNIKPASGVEYLRVFLLNQTKSIKADGCGNYNLNWSNHKEGRAPFSIDTNVTWAGGTFHLGDNIQSAPSGACLTRWSWPSGPLNGLPQKVKEFFTKS